MWAYMDDILGDLMVKGAHKNLERLILNNIQLAEIYLETVAAADAKATRHAQIHIHRIQGDPSLNEDNFAPTFQSCGNGDDVTADGTGKVRGRESSRFGYLQSWVRLVRR